MMKVVTHEDFHQSYTHDPAAAPGRIKAVLDVIRDEAEFVEAVPADRSSIEAVHTVSQIHYAMGQNLYDIAALAAGATIQAAVTGMSEPCFALVRPPGHHASSDSSWGFCYFNNMAVAMEHLRSKGLIKTAYILDFDLHYGDGTVNILRDKGYVAIHNPQQQDRESYLKAVEEDLAAAKVDIIGVSAGFDNHRLDWGGLLRTEDYRAMGRMVHQTCKRLGIGCFAALEGGYNHQVLGENVLAFMRGMQGR